MRVQHSHEDAPARKAANAQDTPVPGGDTEGNLSRVDLMAIRSIMQEEMQSVTKSVDKIAEDLKAFKAKMHDELTAMGLRITSMDELSKASSNKIAELEKELASLNVGGTQRAPETEQETKTVVIGNIPGATSKEKAEEWIRARCKAADIPAPHEMYIKPQELAGILNAKCMSIAHRDQLVTSVRQFVADTSLPKPWARMEMPIDRRMAEGTLFAFKRILVNEWEYTKSEVRVDTDTCTLKIDGQEILQTAVENMTLKMSWCNGEWETWEDFKSMATTIQQSQQAKLDKAKNASSGGKGKKGRGKAPETGSAPK